MRGGCYLLIAPISKIQSGSILDWPYQIEQFLNGAFDLSPDVPPKTRTILSWNFPVMIPDREMESSDEGIEVF